MLSFAFGINIALGNLMRTLNGFILPVIYNEDHLDKLGNALMVGTVLAFVSMITSLFMGKHIDDDLIISHFG